MLTVSKSNTLKILPLASSLALEMKGSFLSQIFITSKMMHWYIKQYGGDKNEYYFK